MEFIESYLLDNRCQVIGPHRVGIVILFSWCVEAWISRTGRRNNVMFQAFAAKTPGLAWCHVTFPCLPLLTHTVPYVNISAFIIWVLMWEKLIFKNHIKILALSNEDLQANFNWISALLVSFWRVPPKRHHSQMFLASQPLIEVLLIAQGCTSYQ